MLHSMKIYQRIVLMLSLLVIGLAVLAWAQNKKENTKVTLKEVVERTGNNSARLKDPSKFEVVKKGKEAVVQFKANKKIVGSLLCGVCPGGKCDTLVDFGGGIVCVGCGQGNKDCTLNPF